MKAIIQRKNETIMCGDGVEFYHSSRHIPHTLIFDPPWDAKIDFSGFDSESILAFTDGGRAGDIIRLFGAPVWIFAWDCVSSWYTPNRPLRRMKMCFWYGDISNYKQKGYLMGSPCGKPRFISNSRGTYMFVPDSGKMLSDVFPLPITKSHSESGSHKHGKPRDWITALVANTHRPGDTIIDPFFGGGSSLLAARVLGIPWRGCELDESLAMNVDDSASPSTSANPDQMNLL